VSKQNEQGAVARRAVLAVGGITLLAGCFDAPDRHAASTAKATVSSTKSATKPAPATSTPPPDGLGPQGHTTGRSQPGSSEPMYYVDDGPKAIALTIDDGPNAVYTPQVLRLLARYRVTAMFSMIGIEVDALPGVARDVAAAGHLISNHTWRHLDLAALSPSAVIDEMDRATTAIHQAIGDIPRKFRAPYGAWSPAVLRHCAQTGMTPIDWSVDPRDWAMPGVSAIVGNIMHNTRTGSIILEHDGGGNRSETVTALGIVIPRLLDAGYHFVTP
jgi:peptidoglycan-N-acetylglucosamine deacetylase